MTVPNSHGRRLGHDPGVLDHSRGARSLGTAGNRPNSAASAGRTREYGGHGEQLGRCLGHGRRAIRECRAQGLADGMARYINGEPYTKLDKRRLTA